MDAQVSLLEQQPSSASEVFQATGALTELSLAMLGGGLGETIVG